jgi:hypothetical protein
MGDWMTGAYRQVETVLGSEEGDFVQEAKFQEGDSDARGLVQAFRADPPKVPAADIDSDEGNVKIRV